MAVSGQIVNSVSLSISSTTNTAGTATESCNLGTTPRTITDGSGDNQFAKVWTGVLTLTTPTAQTIDMTALTGGVGSVSFSTLKFFRVTNRDTTSSSKVLIGPGASNGFVGPFLGTTPTMDAYASGTVTLIDRPLGTGYTVDSTHKTIKFDPGAASQIIEVTLAGT